MTDDLKGRAFLKIAKIQIKQGKIIKGTKSLKNSLVSPTIKIKSIHF
jgi:hypothetical protein